MFSVFMFLAWFWQSECQPSHFNLPILSTNAKMNSEHVSDCKVETCPASALRRVSTGPISAHYELVQGLLTKPHCRPAYLCKHLPDTGAGSQREWKIGVIWPTEKNIQNCHSDGFVIKKEANTSPPQQVNSQNVTPPS